HFIRQRVDFSNSRCRFTAEMMHNSTKGRGLAVCRTVMQNRPQKWDTKLGENVQRIFRERRPRLQVVDHQSRLQAFIDRLERLNELPNPYRSPQIWRRGDNGHEREIRNEQRALGDGTLNRRRTINHDEGKVIGELGNLTVDLVPSSA